MPRFSDMSLTRKLISIMLLISITALLLASVLQSFTEGLAYREQRADYLRTIADLIGTNSVASIIFEDRESAEQVIGSLKADPSIIDGSLVTVDGEILAKFTGQPGSSRAGAPPRSVPGLHEAALSAGGSLIRWNGLSSLDIIRPVDFDGETIGYVHVRSSLQPLVALLVRYLWVVAGILALTIALVIVMSLRLQRLISGPILSLAELMNRVTKDGDYSLRAEPTGRDEVGNLMVGFNTMLAQISERDRRLVEQNRKIDEQARSLASANQRLTLAMRESIEARETAEAANRAKTQFLARMSHEIRTPMNGVLGMTELLLASGLESKQRHFAETIQTSADSLLNLINDILDFSKIESGRLELEDASFDLRSVVESTVELLSVQSQSKELELLCDVDPAMPTGVRGDAMRLRQVLTNLVGNAIKFTDEGDVLVRVRATPLSQTRAEFRFEVTDNGIGIRPENRKMIFELFSQEDGSTTRKYGGTGLGLAICRQLVELMNGEIGVDSVVGRGSTFWFTVPMDLVEDNSGQKPLQQLIDRLPLRLLVVDDNATNREILQLQLEAWGLHVETAESAAAALERLRNPRNRYDLVILDWHMPETNGLELARLIRADSSFDQVSLVMLSSSSVDDAARVIRKAGVDVFTTKPVRQAKLLDCLLAALDRDSGPDADVELPAAGDDTISIRLAGGDVLLVEDNPVNREVAINMLETLRCRITVAVNGREAVARLQKQDFDIVLMDCEMPVLDGYGATREIRDWETGVGGGRHTPIIALTAHALPEDRRRCLEAGMDDYLSKPFGLGDLRERMSRWIKIAELPDGATTADEAPARNAPRSDDETPAADDRPPAVDFQVLESIVSMDPDGGGDLLARLVDVYETSSVELVREIESAFADLRIQDVRKAAHALKSSSGNVGALELFDYCRQLETAIRKQDTGSVENLVAAVCDEHRRVLEVLHASRESRGARIA